MLASVSEQQCILFSDNAGVIVNPKGEMKGNIMTCINRMDAGF